MFLELFFAFISLGVIFTLVLPVVLILYIWLGKYKKFAVFTNILIYFSVIGVILTSFVNIFIYIPTCDVTGYCPKCHLLKDMFGDFFILNSLKFLLITLITYAVYLCVRILLNFLNVKRFKKQTQFRHKKLKWVYIISVAIVTAVSTFLPCYYSPFSDGDCGERCDYRVPAVTPL